MRVSLHEGSPSGPELAYEILELPHQGSFPIGPTSIVFAAPVALTPGNPYAIVVKHLAPTGEVELDGNPLPCQALGNPYPNGQMFNYYSGSWTALPNSDLTFQTYSGTAIAIDLKPGSYPNCVNPRAKGVTPVAVLGLGDFDVTTIDPASIRVVGDPQDVSPLRWAIRDVESPDGMGADGYLDLVLHFKSAELADKKVFDVDGGQFVLTGVLKEEFGGTPVAGSDIVSIAGEEVCENADLF
jgi:hypothetical protein